MWGLLHSWAATDGRDHISGSGASKGGTKSLYFSVQLEADIDTRWERTNLLLLQLPPPPPPVLLRSVRNLLSTTELVSTVVLYLLKVTQYSKYYY